MSKIRKTALAILPPVLVNLVRLMKGSYHVRNDIYFKGDYRNWAEAKQNSSGYENGAILTATKDALLKVKNGEAVYERDSILYDEVQFSWPLLASLLKIAATNEGRLQLVDFGGSLGTTYYQNRSFLRGLKEIQWHIVEQQHIVACGKEQFEDEILQFHDSIDEAGDVNCVLLSGVLQYLPDPYEQINTIISRNFTYVLIDRTSFIDAPGPRLTLQVVPDSIYKASYPCLFFNEKELLAVFESKYQLVASFNSYADNSAITDDGKTLYWKGFFFQLK